MTNDPLSPAGIGSVDGTERKPIPNPPTALQVHFQVLFVVMILTAALALLGALLVE